MKRQLSGFNHWIMITGLAGMVLAISILPSVSRAKGPYIKISVDPLFYSAEITNYEVEFFLGESFSLGLEKLSSNATNASGDPIEGEMKSFAMRFYFDGSANDSFFLRTSATKITGNNGGEIFEIYLPIWGLGHSWKMDSGFTVDGGFQTTAVSVVVGSPPFGAVLGWYIFRVGWTF